MTAKENIQSTDLKGRFSPEKHCGMKTLEGRSLLIEIFGGEY
jgi:hypothetical protein